MACCRMGCLYLAIYVLEAICVFTNLYVLLNRSDTIHYLRIYHLAVGALMVSSGVVQLCFMRKAQLGLIRRLGQPCTIPRHTTVSAIFLTAGIVLGYAYLIVFDAAFSNCDRLIDAKDPFEQLEDAGANLLMIFFCILSLIYIWQRSRFGPLPTCGDKLMRRWVNMVLTVVWVQIVVFKGYLSYQELCQRKELSGYWCPVIERPYACFPERQIKGTQKIWYYLHKGLLNSTIISCASEFFPVLLVAHWIACGGGQKKIEAGAKPAEDEESGKALTNDGRPNYSWVFLLLSLCSAMAVSVNWFVDFYVSIQFDDMHKSRVMLDDYADLGASIAHLLLFSTFWQWSRRRIPSERWDQDQKAKSRGDMVLILGSVSFMTMKLVLQLFELHFQRVDGFLFWNEQLLQSCSIIMIQASQWVQVFCLRYVLCFGENDLHSMRSFLPFVAAAAIAVNAVDFGTTFFETNTIKYQLGLPEHHFSQNTLLSMIFTQTIYPADYLFCFTAAGCWVDVMLRYSEMGMFELGMPAEDEGKDGKSEKFEHFNGEVLENSGIFNERKDSECAEEEEEEFPGIWMSSDFKTQIILP